jgi:hypothetical protein
MLEREVCRKYALELGGAMVLYLAVLVGSIYLAKPMEPGSVRTLLVMTPALPLLILIWVLARQFGRMDEYVRLRNLESLAIAAAMTAGLSFSYGFLEGDGFPRLSMFWVWGIMGVGWRLVHAVRSVVGK